MLFQHRVVLRILLGFNIKTLLFLRLVLAFLCLLKPLLIPILGVLARLKLVNLVRLGLHGVLIGVSVIFVLVVKSDGL